MTYVIYGAVGVIAVLLLLFLGVVIGWRARIAYEKHNRRVVQETMTEEQKLRLKQDHDAFESLMHYSTEMAYGQNPTLEDLAKKR